MLFVIENYTAEKSPTRFQHAAPSVQLTDAALLEVRPYGYVLILFPIFCFREAAEEQYRQQASQVPQYSTDSNIPIPLGGGERQFDPSKSEALKAIQEQDRQRDEFLGYDFFDKVANAETPKVPPHQVACRLHGRLT